MSWEIRQGDALPLLRQMPSESIHAVVTSPPYWGLRDYKMSGQMGLEPTPEIYVTKMVEVFREVKRVLGIPWHVAFALQSDGWWLRSAITLCKLNPMPESVRDRPTSATEMMFLMTKSARYFYDIEATRISHTEVSLHRAEWEKHRIGDKGWKSQHREGGLKANEVRLNPSGRNLRNWWPVVTEPFTGSHFATFGQKWIEPCIRAGTSEKGCCAKCGAPWERMVEKIPATMNIRVRDNKKGIMDQKSGVGEKYRASQKEIQAYGAEQLGSSTTLGWHPTCSCQAETVPTTILDPFVGSGTTGVVALKLGRSFIGIDLKQEYCEMAKRRMGDIMPLFA